MYRIPLSLLLAFALPAAAQEALTEADYYPIVPLPVPEDVVLEVGGLALMPDGSLMASTRRGEVWRVENPYVGDGEGAPFYARFARGLHESLGLAYRDGDFYVAQRGELTRLSDGDGDGQADQYDAVYTWPLSGNYHEYSYGPVVRPDGTMLVMLNVAWEGRGTSPVPWRGWTLEITPDGEMRPFATGMRSPAGFNVTTDGELFYAENQGDWVGAGGITHVAEGDFVGNPAGLRWTDLPGSPLALAPGDVPDTGEPMHVVAERVPELKPPAVWFPHGIMGISTSDILQDTTGGAFGPFEGQLFVGDQGHSKIFRVSLEAIDGVYQGAVYPFREGFGSGVLRMIWGKDGSMFVGGTSRGWRATGEAPYALERLVWSGETPFEVHRIEARPDGFELFFTEPVDAATAADPASYAVTGFTYHYHSRYGSDVIDQAEAPVRGVRVADDGMSARLAVDGLRPGYVHELRLPGVQNAAGQPLLHSVAYYTLNRIPGGAALDLSDASTGATGPSEAAAPTPSNAASAAQPKRLTEQPADWTGGPDATITIGTVPGLRYDTEQVTVEAGSRVRLVFNNDDDMQHNLLVVLPGAADVVGQEALALGLQGPQMEYVPNTDRVLFHTALLQPESSEAIYFIAPEEPGLYEYVCTYPGHFTTMRGVLRVVEG